MSADQQEWLDKSILCWIDYETTGIDFKDPTVKPIEVGVILTDINLCALPGDIAGFACLINWGYEGVFNWSELSDQAAGAFPYHKLTPERLVNEGISPQKAAARFIDVIRPQIPEGGRCILVSDNIQFEWTCTKLLLAEHEQEPDVWPFHYCGWDTSILQLVPGLGFVDPPNPPHRAFQDALGLLQQVRGALFGQDSITVAGIQAYCSWCRDLDFKKNIDRAIHVDIT